jgi:hypothetical protein
VHKTRKHLDLYSYTNFIPGMGYKGSMDKWFPMINGLPGTQIKMQQFKAWMNQ